MKLDGYPKEATLRDGSRVLLRPVVAKDGVELLRFYRALPEEDRLFLRDDVTTPDWEQRYIGSIDYEGVLPLVAEREGAIVGNATLYRPRHGWSAHVAQIRVVVAREYQRHGLGTALAKALVELAIARGVEKMVAEVVDNQIGALRAFERLGFHREAVLKGHVKDVRGMKRDLVMLANDVSHLWEAMEALVSDYSPTREG